MVLTQMLRTGVQFSRQLGAPDDKLPDTALDTVIASEERRASSS